MDQPLLAWSQNYSPGFFLSPTGSAELQKLVGEKLIMWKLTDPCSRETGESQQIVELVQVRLDDICFPIKEETKLLIISTMKVLAQDVNASRNYELFFARDSS